MALDKSFAVYRSSSSLFFVVHPWSRESTVEDGVRISVSPENVEKFTNCGIEILTQMKIPFIELLEPNLEKRIEIIQAAVVTNSNTSSNANLNTVF